MSRACTRGCRTRPRRRPYRSRHHLATSSWALLVAGCLGCGSSPPPASVEGALRIHGKPLDRCLVTYLPEAPGESPWTRATGLTDGQGRYRLTCDDQQEGVGTGWHRVTIHDLTISTGVVRRDHGTIDAKPVDELNRSAVQGPRVPSAYASPTTTPLRRLIEPGPQVIDLDIE